MLRSEKGVPWAGNAARNGSEGIPEHPAMEPSREQDTSLLDNEPPPGSLSISQILSNARARLTRLVPQQVYAEYLNQTPTKPVILVDIRPAAQRAEKGSIQGSLIVERNVLEWRFDPRSDARLPIAGRYDLRIIVFCQEGYTSSLAANALQELGLGNATDMDGGYRAWKEAGLPENI
jgi:rhodanese-related sulfurtransferase